MIRCEEFLDVLAEGGLWLSLFGRSAEKVVLKSRLRAAPHERADAKILHNLAEASGLPIGLCCHATIRENGGNFFNLHAILSIRLRWALRTETIPSFN